MPNTPVRAAAEGVPNVNRRSALAASGVGLVAALLGAAPSKAAPAPVASRMAALEASSISNGTSFGLWSLNTVWLSAGTLMNAPNW
ncbi:hypothetical protein EN833_08470 [Mesorhizobium sp. M4B.F.Ca.ET.190.01.1.1]|uniref:hypothetical protein n=1 Tax=unclassified Mesorhizobium TaxID=325217 RepID=UPI001092A72B|nr:MULTISPECIES: hypothetical protein [unclassified Mesorhizobium]TGR13192.1 hypothetical protein EN843_08465 [Mesorhizobium sp. M4B.F.Ca.ET.200.01.1.1]TGS21403.1 hypothetical protein EN833_08470 [Mesorhizobium sp. M4B.F.Ca.ET.190.01.1.1]TGT32966.1 hypothetical protein EN815_11010 [Mesorhizobium sp. M4B.F.Ca.ET.172.01.1.1]